MQLAYATLDTEQLVSNTRTAVVNTIASLQDSDGGVIPVQEVLELLTKIWHILDNAVSKWVGNKLIFKTFFLILFSASVMKSGLCSIPFFTFSRTLFLLVKLAFMAALIALWHRFSKNLPLPCLSLSPL